MTNQATPANDCPTPTKVRYATAEAAVASADRYQATGRPLRPYKCPCGWVHLTSRPQHTPPVHVENPSVTAEVAAMPDGIFQALVAAEVKGWAPPEQAAALRTGVNIARWSAALQALEVELMGQLTRRKGDRSEGVAEWRGRVMAMRSWVSQRRAEAKVVRVRLHGQGQARRAVEGVVSVRQARAAAGDAAIQRLIDAHEAEFGLLLAEEFERAGLEVPARVARHVARHAAVAS